MVFPPSAGMNSMVKPGFVHLHVHSVFSYRDGAAPVGRLVEKAWELNMEALALTDHNTLSGAVRFYGECQKAGIRPIIGAEIDMACQAKFVMENGCCHLLLLCRNLGGYSNLCRLLTEAHLSHRDENPVATRDMLAKYSAGLIAISPVCGNGEIASLLARGDEKGAAETASFYRQLFPDSFYIELVHYPSPSPPRYLRSLVQFAEEQGLPVVATNNVHYVEMKDYALKELRQAIYRIIPVEALVEEATCSWRDESYAHPANSGQARTVEEYLKPAWEMEALFREVPRAFKAAAGVAEQCRLDLPLGKPKFPPFHLLEEVKGGAQAGQTQAGHLCHDEKDKALGFLWHLAREGAQSLYLDVPQRRKAEERLEREMEVIGKLGFETYFLVAWDIARFACEKGIRFHVRGSAVNSLVVHCLGISAVDPLEHDLLFERFMHLGRREMPDIDWDFQRTRRDEVRDHIQRKYGKENVAAVATISTYRARGVAREVGKALGMPQRFIEEVLQGVRWQSFSSILEGLEKGEAPPEIKANKALSQAFPYRVGARLPRPYGGDARVKTFLRLCAALDGFPCHLSVHLGGLVIGPAGNGLTSLTLLQWTTGGDIISQYDKDDIEKLGLIKMDIIPMPTLDVIEDSVTEIKRNRGVKVDIEAIPRDDPAVFAMHRRSETIGTFQVESPAQREMASRLRPDKYEDLILLLALVRPGPMKSRMHEHYLRRRYGLEPVTYPHPSLEKVLKETLGQIVYREQVLQVAHELAGLSYEEADGLRRAMTHERTAEEMGKMREIFVYSAVSRGVSEEVALQVWKQVSEFASYGFPKGHAVAYARVAYQTLWLKRHYPAEFLAAALSNQPMGYYPPRVLLMEARARGLRTLSPDVNRSCSHYSAEGDAIRIGLAQVKSMTGETMRSILAEREKGDFSSLEDFVRHVEAPCPAVENLIRAGAFSSVSAGHSRTGMLRSLPTLLDSKRKGWSTVYSLLPTSYSLLSAIYREGKGKGELRERMKMEMESLGFSLESHPLDVIGERLKAKGITRLKDLSLEKDGEKVRLAGAVVRYQSPPVRGDCNPMVFLCLEDGTGVISVAVFRDVQEKSGAVLFQEEWVVVEGTAGRRPLASPFSSAGLSVTATALFPLRKYLNLKS